MSWPLPIGVATAVVLALAGCTGSSATTSGAKGSSAERTWPAATTVAIGDGRSLRTYLISPIEGATAISVPDSTLGVQTPKQYTDESFDDPAYELARLTGAGLAVVAVSNWQEPSGDRVEAKLLQFRSADGALGNLISQEQADADDPTRTDSYPLDGYVEGRGFEANNSDSDGFRRATLVGQDGSIALIIHFYTKKAIDRAAETAFFKKQFSALQPSNVLPPLPATTTQTRKALVPRAPARIAFGDGAALHKRLVSFAAVNTYKPTGSTNGIYTIDQFAGINPDQAAAAKRLLQTWKFGTAAANDLLNANGIEVFTRLAQFHDASGAADLYASDLKSRLASSLVGQSFPLAGADHAYGIEYPGYSTNGYRTITMLYADGPIYVVVDVYISGQLDWAFAITALQSQIDELAQG